MPDSTLRITQRRSSNGTNRVQRDTLRSLGLRGVGKSVERPDGPALRGMLRVVDHLIDVSQPEAKPARKAKDSDG